jgi:hypothetical protein
MFVAPAPHFQATTTNRKSHSRRAAKLHVVTLPSSRQDQSPVVSPSSPVHWPPLRSRPRSSHRMPRLPNRPSRGDARAHAVPRRRACAAAHRGGVEQTRLRRRAGHGHGCAWRDKDSSVEPLGLARPSLGCSRRSFSSATGPVPAADLPPRLRSVAITPITVRWGPPQWLPVYTFQCQNSSTYSLDKDDALYTAQGFIWLPRLSIIYYPSAILIIIIAFS